MHRIKNELNKLISNTILIVQLHQLKTQTVPVHIKNIDLNINNTTGMGELLFRLCEIKKNVSSSGLDELDICIKFYGIMHWTLAYTTACTVLTV